MPSAPESGLAALRRRIPTGLAGGVFWLALWFALLWVLRLTPIPGRSFFGWMELLVGATLFSLAVVLAIRTIRRHLLWRLRNKLVITYLLIGLAPFALVLILVALSAYVAAGQFSIHLADSRLHQQLDQIGEMNSARASGFAARFLRERSQQASAPPQGDRGPRPPRGDRFRPGGGRFPPRGGPPAPEASSQQPSATSAAPTAAQSAAQEAAAALGETAPNPLLTRLHPFTADYINGVPIPFGGGPRGPEPAPSAASVPLGLPAWAADLHGLQFRGLVVDGEDLFLVAIDQRHIEGVGLLTVLTSLPVNADLMDVVAEGLGQVHLSSIAAGNARTAAEQAARAARRAQSSEADSDRTSIYGGQEPVPVNACDFGVPFLSTTAIRDWGTGEPDEVPIVVHSRPSVLYRQLFGSSLSGVVTSSIRVGFIAICLLFALIEAGALWAALRLSRQITTSVEELYAGTQRVDRGDLAHRIPAHATRNDQLGELSRSFNRMTGSLERLLVEQQEKERLQSEITIAQEVQANLFPHHVHDLPTLELHGVCRPARSVSGDYYDFFVFHGPAADDSSLGPETGVGIALGDISGKGISAALLMATLHSAVRAYRLVSEDLANEDDPFPAIVHRGDIHTPASGIATASALSATALLAHKGSSVSDAALFASPARILALVNRHLYLSTQPEKYATLFLAQYDAATARLTYSNAGHLPPILLGRDGSVRRLDQGGTVVGLFPGTEYEDGHIQMHSGDILIGYSDGITEPENDFGEFGEARLIETVARYRDQPLHVISAQVMLALDAWIGAVEQPDDITLVLARQA